MLPSLELSGVFLVLVQLGLGELDMRFRVDDGFQESLVFRIYTMRRHFLERRTGRSWVVLDFAPHAQLRQL